MIIRKAMHSDIDEIKRLWIDCFHDPFEYIDFFIKNRFSEKYCCVLEDNHAIIGMIHFLPCQIEPNQKALYWYAAGISSNRRGEGLFRKFTEFILDQSQKRGYKNLCVPAPGLEKFYQSIGMKYSYIATDLICKKNPDEKEIDSVEFYNATPETFSKLKKLNGDTVWDSKAIQYAIEENQYCGGKALLIKLNEKNYSCFAISKENGFLIDYHDLTLETFLEIKTALFKKLNCDQLIFRTTESSQKTKIIGLSDSDLVGSNSKITMTLA